LKNHDGSSRHIAQETNMTDIALDPPPIACSLGAGDLKARVAWIAALNARALLSHRRDDLALHLTYLPDAVDQVREMVAKEKACCPFLDFALRQDEVGLQLTITAPEAAGEAARLVFEPFTSKTAADAASADCGCCGGVAA
jgi:hypothetical protein